MTEPWRSTREYIKLGAMVFHDFETEAPLTLNVVACPECGAILQAHNKELHDAFHDTIITRDSLRLAAKWQKELGKMGIS